MNNNMPAGLKLMMKSFGIDPESIAKLIGESVKTFMAKVDELQATQTRIEESLSILHTKIDAIGYMVGNESSDTSESVGLQSRGVVILAETERKFDA
jgi:hypothetical protein